MTQTLFDENAALEALNGDRQLLGELAIMFVEDAPTLLQELQSAVDRQDKVIAHRTVHSLRGLSSTFFATDIIELAGRLEQDLKSGDLGSLCNGGLLALKSSIDDLAKKLQESGVHALEPLCASTRLALRKPDASAFRLIVPKP